LDQNEKKNIYIYINICKPTAFLKSRLYSHVYGLIERKIKRGYISNKYEAFAVRKEHS